MAEEPDRLKRDIENTRASLTRDVDRLADHASPKRIAQRRWTTVREKVMGGSEHAKHAAGGTVDTMQEKAGHASEAVGEKAHQAADAVRGAPQAVAQQTKGNPLAAGIIAFGAGMLAATLLPVSDVERRAGQQIKENTEELTERVKDVASDVGSEVKRDAQQAAQQVKETAQDAAQTTRDQAQSSSQQAAQQTKDAARNQ